MDQKAIFQSLSELEKSLSTVSSAAAMVKKTTESYDALQSQAKRYCQELMAITAQLKQLSVQMDENYASILTDTNSRGNAILSEMALRSKELIKQAETTYKDFQKNAEKQFLNAASDMEAKTQEILNEVKSGQDALRTSTDEKLSGSLSAFDRDAKSILAGMQEQFSSELTKTTGRIDAEVEILKKNLRDFADMVTSLDTVVQTTRQSFSEEHQLLDGKRHSLDETLLAIKKAGEVLEPQFASLREEYSKQQATLEKIAAKCGGITLWVIILTLVMTGCNIVLFFTMRP